MRLVSPYSVLVFIIVWTIVFLLASRRFLFSAHQVSLYVSSRMYYLSPLPFFFISSPPFSPLSPLRADPLPSSTTDQSWFEGEEHKFVQELELKLENLDARDLRQLNELYAEMKRVDGEQLRWKGLYVGPGLAEEWEKLMSGGTLCMCVYVHVHCRVRCRLHNAV